MRRSKILTIKETKPRRTVANRKQVRTESLYGPGLMSRADTPGPDDNRQAEQVRMGGARAEEQKPTSS